MTTMFTPDHEWINIEDHDAAVVGTRLRADPPRNRFGLAPGGRSHVLLAAGVGLTPLMAMAEQLSRQGAPFALHHATRSRARTPFLARIAASAFASRLSISEPPSGNRLIPMLMPMRCESPFRTFTGPAIDRMIFSATAVAA